MNGADPNTAGARTDRTEVGSVFVSNYPPYSFWSRDAVGDALAAVDAPPSRDATLGLYVHIPFCRLRCKFCYFKVYTDKDSSQVHRYLAALVEEARMYAGREAVRGRPLEFVYFGGGTPSFISSRQLRELADGLKGAIPWNGVREVTFECEPGTLTEHKVHAIRDVGVTRLSLGVEHFDDDILKENGRAHLSAEIERCRPWIRAAGFDQLNVDLIAGMVGESWDTWKDAVRKTIDMDPDSVTIYQMEVPYNAVYSGDLREGRLPVAGWPQKREWHAYAIDQLESAGYEVSSAYTMVKRASGKPFVYRNAVWHGTDMIGTGVASFGHFQGTHLQNLSEWDAYLDRVEAGGLPLGRAYRTSPEERLTRELILQLKLGSIRSGYFREKFGVEILERFGPALKGLQAEGMLEVRPESGEIALTRTGLLQVDTLLSDFYAPEHRNSRYT